MASPEFSLNSGGFRLRQARLRLGLTYREVEHASATIAAAKLNPEYLLNLSRLADIENHGVLPTIYRIYSLCVIYGLDVAQVLAWYGVDSAGLLADQNRFQPDQVGGRTRLLGAPPDHLEVRMPVRLDPGLNVRDTSYLTRMIEAWGLLPLAMLNQLNLRDYRYGSIGREDWMMYPLVPPGSLVQIDPTRTAVEQGGWRNEFERPIYFLELRESYACAWCALEERRLILQPHPVSPCAPVVLEYPREAEIIGQVVGVAQPFIWARNGWHPPAAKP